jgi:hypothetical protein
MHGFTIDLVRVAEIWMGGVVLLVPLLGLTARLGVVPVLDAVARVRGTRGEREMEERLTRIEERLDDLVSVLERAAGERAA